MTSFMQDLLGSDAGKHVTMDDVLDEDMMKMEDDEDEEQSQSSGSEDEEVDGVIEANMYEMDDHDIGPQSTDDDEEEDDEIDESSFEGRLRRIRAQAGAAKNGDGFFEWSSEDEDEDDVLGRYMTWADKDEAVIEHIQVCRPSSTLTHDLIIRCRRICWMRTRMSSQEKIGNRRKDYYSTLSMAMMTTWKDLAVLPVSPS